MFYGNSIGQVRKGDFPVWCFSIEADATLVIMINKYIGPITFRIKSFWAVAFLLRLNNVHSSWP